MAAALSRDIPITEYAPLKIKMAITGNGQASKEQVADMLQRMLHFAKEDMPVFMDATDGLAGAFFVYSDKGKIVHFHVFLSIIYIVIYLLSKFRIRRYFTLSVDG